MFQVCHSSKNVNYLLIRYTKSTTLFKTFLLLEPGLEDSSQESEEDDNLDHVDTLLETGDESGQDSPDDNDDTVDNAGDDDDPADFEYEGEL